MSDKFGWEKANRYDKGKYRKEDKYFWKKKLWKKKTKKDNFKLNKNNKNNYIKRTPNQNTKIQKINCIEIDCKNMPPCEKFLKCLKNNKLEYKTNKKCYVKEKI